MKEIKGFGQLPIQGRELPIMPKGFIRGRLYEDDVLVALIIKDGSQNKVIYLR